MRKWPSDDSFTSTLDRQVAATQLTPTSAQPNHPERREVSIILEQEDECEPVPLASKMASN